MTARKAPQNLLLSNSRITIIKIACVDQEVNSLLETVLHYLKLIEDLIIFESPPSLWRALSSAKIAEVRGSIFRFLNGNFCSAKHLFFILLNQFWPIDRF
jgi:hypothetical protein